MSRAGGFGIGIHRQGDLLFHALGDSIYSDDVSNPRHPRETNTDAWGNIICADECPGYFWRGGSAVLVSAAGQVVSVTLPDAGFPSWRVELADPDETLTTDSEALDDNTLAIAQVSLGGSAGRLSLVEIEPDPKVISLVEGSATLRAIAASPNTVFAASDDPAFSSNLLVYDVSDRASPVLDAVIPLFPPGYFLTSLEWRGSDLILAALNYESDAILRWYKVADDERALTLITETTYYKPLIGNNSVIYDRFLFLPIYGDSDGGDIGMGLEPDWD